MSSGTRARTFGGCRSASGTSEAFPLTAEITHQKRVHVSSAETVLGQADKMWGEEHARAQEKRLQKQIKDQLAVIQKLQHEMEFEMEAEQARCSSSRRWRHAAAGGRSC